MTMTRRGREEDVKLSMVTRKYRGRELDLACLAAVALVSLSLWPRGPGRQVVKSKAWQMAEGVGECLDGCEIAIKEEGPITAWARRVCRSWMGCTGRAHHYSLPPCLDTNQHQHIKQTQLLSPTPSHAHSHFVHLASTRKIIGLLCPPSASRPLPSSSPLHTSIPASSPAAACRRPIHTPYRRLIIAATATAFLTRFK